ncbi:glycosyltransferase [Marinobacter sp. M216]|uniref:Glycosyltransferase n=1 Tax=Marinobacter albus TaxID=3030833 RepID=A0ABT7HA88_9GAMM|nr:glycosyltransferase [Marinobacter sp. M216]MDK9557288.1 glycosyltransferase [Marinobacter sp. M216]
MSHIEAEGINVRYVSSKLGKIERFYRLISLSLSVIRKNPSAHIFIVYFPFCSLVSLFCRRSIILDFRTASVSPNKLARGLRDLFSTFESLFFQRVSVISEGLARMLRIKKRKVFILPLGADVISSQCKKFDYPRLFYIGTFGNRNLHHVIKGLSLAIDKRPELASCISFDIVGFGYGGEESSLKELAGKLGLNKIVRFHGRLFHNEAKGFFDKSNIGISYVPITSYYDHQPPTKTYEYILSGIPVIATATSENSRLVSSVNGVLCQDTPESFANALLECVDRFPDYDSEVIRSTLADATWENIAAKFKRQLVNGR